MGAHEAEEDLLKRGIENDKKYGLMWVCCCECGGVVGRHGRDGVPKGLQFLAELYTKMERYGHALETQLDACVEKIKAYDDVLLFAPKMQAACVHQETDRPMEKSGGLSANALLLYEMQSELTNADTNSPQVQKKIEKYNQILTGVQLANTKHNKAHAFIVNKMA